MRYGMEEWQAARNRLREAMRAFVNSLSGRTVRERCENAASRLGPGWSRQNVEKAYGSGEPNFLPRVEQLVTFCRVAGVSLQELLHGEARPTDLEVALEEYLTAKLSQRLPSVRLRIDVLRVLEECVARLEQDFRAHESRVRQHYGVHGPLWDLLHFAGGVQIGLQRLGRHSEAIHELIRPVNDSVMRGEPMRILREVSLPPAPAAWYSDVDEERAALWPTGDVMRNPRRGTETADAIEHFAESLVLALSGPPSEDETPAFRQLRTLLNQPPGERAAG